MLPHCTTLTAASGDRRFPPRWQERLCCCFQCKALAVADVVIKAIIVIVVVANADIAATDIPVAVASIALLIPSYMLLNPPRLECSLPAAVLVDVAAGVDVIFAIKRANTNICVATVATGGPSGWERNQL